MMSRLLRCMTTSCPGATVDGGILLNGALRIELRCIAVTGGDEDFGGIEATESKALLEDVEIIGSIGLQSTGTLFDRDDRWNNRYRW